MPPRTSVTGVGFYEYVKRISGGESDERIAARIGVTGSTVNRWKIRDPNPRDVAQFSKVYERSWLEAMSAAFEPPADAGLTVTPDINLLSDEELVAEVLRRMRRGSASPQDQISYSDRLTRRQAAARAAEQDEG